MVAFQGEAGAYSDEAARELVPGAQTRGCASFREAFDALLGGEVEAAVLPVENSLAGIVQEVNDLLWERPELRLEREHLYPVVHCLLSVDGPVRQAISHPQALAQCRRWLERHGIEPIPFHDTAGAARHLAEIRRTGLGAIASRAAAARYGLRVVAEGIQDDPSNQTRFAVVRRGDPVRPGDAPAGHKVSLAFAAPHRPGSLVACLQCFSDRGINLTRLDSRPVPNRPFEYRFYLDFEVGDDPAQAEEALRALEEIALQVRLFGAYPAGRALSEPATLK
ncbi:MAG TPA: prephenate dehydratase [Candidatus Acidoferrales bacterium]|nr:prephenate dehydratase [Candidatus Acidoferrales bacterium]